MDIFLRELSASKAKKMPFMTIGILCASRLGIDVKAQMSPGTYYAHRKILEAHGYELAKPKHGNAKK